MQCSRAVLISLCHFSTYHLHKPVSSFTASSFEPSLFASLPPVDIFLFFFSSICTIHTLASIQKKFRTFSTAKMCAQRQTTALGSPSGDVPAYTAQPGYPRTDGPFLHARLEPRDHRNLRSD